MAKTKAQKKEQVQAYRETLSGVKSVFVVKTNGVSANDSVALKKAVIKLNSSYNVVKNSLFQIALKDEKLPEMPFMAEGPHAVVFVGDQISETAKIIAEYARNDANKEKMTIEGGLLNGDLISGKQVEALADLPSKDVLIGQLLGVMNGPMRGLVTVMNGPMRALAIALNGIAEKKS